MDFLVIEPQVEDRVGEVLRLRQMLRPLRIAVDLVVLSQERFDYWKDTPNTLPYRAVKEGRLYEQVA